MINMDFIKHGDSRPPTSTVHHPTVNYHYCSPSYYRTVNPVAPRRSQTARQLVHEVGELGDALAGALPSAWERAVLLGEGRYADGRAEAVADLKRRAAVEGKG